MTAVGPAGVRYHVSRPFAVPVGGGQRSAEERAAGAPGSDPCPRCGVLVLLVLDGVPVMARERKSRRLRVGMQTPRQLMGCPDCGAVAVSTGRIRT